MTLPAESAQWATDAAADIDEPSAGRKQDGWAASEKPPAGWLNWWQNNVYETLAYLKWIPVSNWFGATPDDSFAGRWRAITFKSTGLKYYVAVGNAGEIQYSYDAVAWTQATAGGAYSDSLNGVCYGTDKFVTVGDNGEIQYDADGFGTWTQATAGGTYSDDFWAVCFGDGLFVAVGQTGAIHTDANGTGTWTEQTAADSFTGIFTGVVYSSDLSLYCAVGTSGAIQTSPDGVTWTTRTPAASYSQDFEGVTYGNGMFVAVGEQGERQHSADGINWSQGTDPFSSTSYDLDAVAFGNGLFVAVGGDLANVISGGAIQTSIDGIIWTNREGLYQSGNDIEAVVYGLGKFVCCKSDGSLLYSLRTE